MAVPKLLIDGYNVLFQSPLVGRGRGRDWLVAARGRLLQLLSSRLTQVELSTTQLVFDAPEFGQAPPDATYPSGLMVCYSVDHAEADDLLEEIIRQHPTPKQLTVVSSDQRVRRCARARRASSVDAEQFLEELERRPNQEVSLASLSQPTLPTEELSTPNPTSQPSAEKSDSLSADEVAYWLDEFGKGRKLSS